MLKHARIRFDLRSERGTSLIELLVVSAMLAGIMGALFGLYNVSVSEQQRVEGRVRGIIDQKNGLERMSRELRQATRICTVYPTCAITFTGSGTVDFERCNPNGSGGCTLTWVRYNCTGTPAQAIGGRNITTRACLRSESTTGGGLAAATARPVIRNLDTTPANTFSLSQANYVQVALRVKAKGANNAFALEDGVRFRNVNEVADSGEVGD